MGNVAQAASNFNGMARAMNFQLGQLDALGLVDKGQSAVYAVLGLVTAIVGFFMVVKITKWISGGELAAPEDDSDTDRWRGHCLSTAQRCVATKPNRPCRW